MLLFASSTTDKPVWFLFGATAVLALATVGLVAAAIKALGQVAEIKTDRHLQFISEYGRRWDGETLREARDKQAQMPNSDLANFVALWLDLRQPVSSPVPLLLRIPNFFEDLGITADAGKIDIAVVVRSFGLIIEDVWFYWGLPSMRCGSAPLRLISSLRL
jgi:hypothetical protein